MSHKVRCVLYELLIARTFHHSSSFGFTAFAFIFMVGGRRFGDSLLVMANSLTLHRVPQSWMAPNIFYSFRRRIIWTEDLFAQYVVFLCSCDYFFHAHFFYSTIPMLNVGVFYVSCVLRTLQQFTCIRILLDLLWLSAGALNRQGEQKIWPALVHLCARKRKIIIIIIWVFSLFSIFYFRKARLVSRWSL